MPQRTRFEHSLNDNSFKVMIFEAKKYFMEVLKHIQTLINQFFQRYARSPRGYRNSGPPGLQHKKDNFAKTFAPEGTANVRRDLLKYSGLNGGNMVFKYVWACSIHGRSAATEK